MNLNIVAPEHAAALLRTHEGEPPRGPAGGYAGPSAMPPEERFVPRFAAEPPQEELPYGRWEERLRGEFLTAAAEPRQSQEDLGEPGEIVWYPGPQLARAHVRARDLASRPAGTSCSATCASSPPARTGNPSDFSAHVDFTEETAERNPDWTPRPVRRGDRRLARARSARWRR